MGIADEPNEPGKAKPQADEANPGNVAKALDRHRLRVRRNDLEQPSAQVVESVNEDRGDQRLSPEVDRAHHIAKYERAQWIEMTNGE